MNICEHPDAPTYRANVCRECYDAALDELVIAHHSAKQAEREEAQRLSDKAAKIKELEDAEREYERKFNRIMLEATHRHYFPDGCGSSVCTVCNAPKPLEVA